MVFFLCKKKYRVLLGDKELILNIGGLECRFGLSPTKQANIRSTSCKSRLLCKYLIFLMCVPDHT